MNRSKAIVWLLAIMVLVGTTCSHARQVFKPESNMFGNGAKACVASSDSGRFFASENLECDRSSERGESVTDDPESTSCAVFCKLKRGARRTACFGPKAAGKAIQAAEAIQEGYLGKRCGVEPADIKTICVVCAECDVQSRK